MGFWNEFWDSRATVPKTPVYVYSDLDFYKCSKSKNFTPMRSENCFYSYTSNSVIGLSGGPYFAGCY